MSQDLEALVKENQAVSSELAAVVQARDAHADEARKLGARVTSAEQLLKAKVGVGKELLRVGRVVEGSWGG